MGEKSRWDVWRKVDSIEERTRMEILDIPYNLTWNEEENERMCEYYLCLAWSMTNIARDCVNSAPFYLRMERGDSRVKELAGIRRDLVDIMNRLNTLKRRDENESNTD